MQNMKITSSMETYSSPLTDVFETSAQDVLCQSGPEGRNTEKITPGSYYYDDSWFEE